MKAVAPLHGPLFNFVETVSAGSMAEGAWNAPRKPLLIKNRVRQWAAWDRWSFDYLANLRHADGTDAVVKFQNGLVEQGQTRERPHLPVSSYLRELGASSLRTHRTDAGLLTVERQKALPPGTAFTLDWSYMQTFKPDRLYLAQWNILDEFPALRRDFAIRQLWPGRRWTWEYAFIGPENTVTGLHWDFPDNWLCQVRGTKEVILFPSDQTDYLSPSEKYDWGAVLSAVDISNLHDGSAASKSFARAQGLYARLEPGDALFIPKQTWHAVVSLEPSISLAVFGLTLPEILWEGGAATIKNLAHRMRVYKWGNCTCHAG